MNNNNIRFLDVRITVEEYNRCYGDVLLITKDNKVLGRNFEDIPEEKMGYIVDLLIKNTKEEVENV